MANRYSCILTFDIEEWFQVENLKGAISHREWSNKKSSVEENVGKILTFLSGQRIKGTFFILGWVAERHPEMVRRIHQQGHEIACHGYNHELMHKLKNSEMRKDVLKSKTILEEIIGEKILGFRAPSFSINDTLIALLEEFGFLYDSSYNPFSLNSRHGQLSVPLNLIKNGLYRLGKNMFEIPISTVRFWEANIPMAGGAYFRIIPFWLLKRLIARKLSVDGNYNFYLHPWELEPGQERVTDIKLNYRLRHYYGLSHTEKKLARLIQFLRDQNVTFLTAREFVEQSVATI